MDIKQGFVIFFTFFSCYLISSITFVSAYQVGEVLNTDSAKFVIEPAMKIVDELEPINCESTGYITFRAYVENIPEFDIESIDALIEDKSTGIYYNITTAVTCSPEKNIISNQEITCRVKIQELLSRIPSCPLGRIKNDFYLTLGISYVNKEAKVTAEKDIIITSAGVSPYMEVNFNVASPPYPVPQINCLTGSEFDVPVLIEHAETLSGDISWSFSIDGKSYGGGLIDCEKLLEREGKGIEHIYTCTLTVTNNLFSECDGGKAITVGISAKNNDYELYSDFPTSLVSEELDLSLKITGLKKIDCQIISEEGLCVPYEPQQNITATITGNVPQKIKVFETRYKIDNGNITTLYCEKQTYNRYQCSTFIPLAELDMPEDKYGKTNTTKKLTVFFDLKHLNYYTNVSSSTTYTMEGEMIQELIDTLKVLREDKRFLSGIENRTKWLEKAYMIINFISMCCGMKTIAKQLNDGDYITVLKQFAQMYLWGPANKFWDKVLGLITQNGPGIIGCIAKKGMDDIDEEFQKLEDFENGGITTEMSVPSFGEMMGDHIVSCTAQNFWDKIKSSWGMLLCLTAWLIPGVSGAMATVCKIWNSPVISAIKQVFNILVTVVSALILYNTITTGLKSMALATERMNLQVAASNAMADYSEKLSATMSSMATSLSTNAALYNITYGDYDTVKMIFISDRTGVLANGDEICTGDEITIDYDFEKLEQVEGFMSELDISSSTHYKKLILDELKGTHGPTKTDALLGTDPAADISETYTFLLNYQDKSISYELEYVNSPCI